MSHGFSLARLLDNCEDPPDRWDEASLRSSVSRAYYAAFGETRNYLETARGSRVRGTDVHRQVSDMLTADPRTECKLLGSNLNNLKATRNRADYDPSPAVDVRTAAKAIVDAEQLLEDLERIRTDEAAGD